MTKSLVKRGPGRQAATLATTAKQREKFLETLSKTLNVTKSAKAAGIPRATVYDWRGKWASFREAWEEAKAEGVDFLLEQFRDITEDPDTPAKDRLGGIKFLLQIHAPQLFNEGGGATKVSVSADAETGRAEVIIATAAPGVLDRLLDDSPYMDPGEEE